MNRRKILALIGISTAVPLTAGLPSLGARPEPMDHRETCDVCGKQGMRGLTITACRDCDLLGYHLKNLFRIMSQHGGEIVLSPAGLDAYEQSALIVKRIEAEPASLAFSAPKVRGIPIRCDYKLAKAKA